VRYAWLAALLATGCGAVVAPAGAPPDAPAGAPPDAPTGAPGGIRPACGGAVAPSSLAAIHFLTPEIGMGLTVPGHPCGTTLAVTRDGGWQWLAQGTALAGGGTEEQLVATSTSDAWAAVGGGRLMATTDGGATWTVESPRGRVAALARARHALWMLDCLGGSGATCVEVPLRKVLPDGAWTITGPKLVATPYPELFVRDGGTIVIGAGGHLVIVGNRVTERSDPVWMGQPCSPAGLAAAGRSWWLLCLGGAAAGSSEKALFRTTDRGKSWTVVSELTSLTAPPPPGAITPQEPDALAAGSPTRLWLAAENNLYESGDGGARWSRAPGPDPQGSPASFDVLSPTHVWLLAAGQGLWRTTDGRHWTTL
jgi:photosystem II stability/assembly factor-like uncharacterized protein